MMIFKSRLNISLYYYDYYYYYYYYYYYSLTAIQDNLR